MEHTAFEHFSHILRSKARAVGLGFFKEEETAEDIAQETMISLWKAWGTLSSPLEAERLAIRIAKHECINVWRKAQRQPHSSLTISHEIALPASNEERALEESELRTNTPTLRATPVADVCRSRNGSERNSDGNRHRRQDGQFDVEPRTQTYI